MENTKTDLETGLMQAIVPIAEKAILQALENIQGPQIRPDPDLMFSDEAAKLLGISKSTLYVKTCYKQLPFVKRGKRLFFSRKKLHKYIENGYNDKG